MSSPRRARMLTPSSTPWQGSGQVPSVLWSLWTMPNKSTGFTPFFMVYWAEVVLPTDL
jgi:hypothetical protein